MTIRTKIKLYLLRHGIWFSRVGVEAGAPGDARRRCSLGLDPFFDMTVLTQADAPVIFDIGANLGQSVAAFRESFPNSSVHSFEPSPTVFRQLEANTKGLKDVYLNNAAMGSSEGKMVLIENADPGMSSLLEVDQDCWGKVTGRCEVEIDTVDNYCKQKSVTHIDILKSDTQGFDYQVFQGSRDMFARHGVHLIFVEFVFSQLYKGQARFEDIHRFLIDQGFSLVAIYPMHLKDNRASWTDALYVDPLYSSPGDSSPAKLSS
jgi:FkbM family methyltransferase